MSVSGEHASLKYVCILRDIENIGFNVLTFGVAVFVIRSDLFVLRLEFRPKLVENADSGFDGVERDVFSAQFLEVVH